jgi:hypothetical protein
MIIAMQENYKKQKIVLYVDTVCMGEFNSFKEAFDKAIELEYEKLRKRMEGEK